MKLNLHFHPKAFITIGFLFMATGLFAQPLTTLYKAEIALETGDFPLAITHFSEIIALTQSDYRFQAYYGRAYAHYKQGNFQASEPDLQEALKVPKTHKGFQEIKGNSYWLYFLVERKDGITPKSLKHLNRATDFMETSLLYSTKGYAESYLGKHKKALISLNHSLLLDPNNAWAYNNRAFTHLQLGKTNIARIDVNRSLELDAKNPYAYKNSGLIYLELNDTIKACKAFEKAIHLDIYGRMSGYDAEAFQELHKRFCN